MAEAAPGSRSLQRLLWLAIGAAATLPFLLARYPPLYDYHHWVYQGFLFARLLVAPAGDPLHALFSLYWKPIPNLAANVGMGLLNLVLDPADAGRVFLALTVLVVATGFALLARIARGQPTAVELLGALWAFGFFLYSGYLSYLFSIGAALAAVALLHRAASAPEGLRPLRLLGLALASVGVYFCHIFGWGTLALATYAYAFLEARQRHFRRALSLLATLVPAALILVVFIGGRGHTLFDDQGEVRAKAYASAADKGVSLLGSLALFLRTDPLPSPLPTFVANLAAYAGVALVLILSWPRGGEPRVARPLFFAGAIQTLFALVFPYGDLARMGRPDERLLLPGLLLLMAAVRWRAPARRACLAAAGLVLAVIALHAVVFHRASRATADILARVESTVPPEAPLLALNLYDSRLDGACEESIGPTVGRPALKWIALYRALSTGRLRLELMESGVVRREFPSTSFHDVTVNILPRGDLHRRVLRNRWPYVVVLGCRDDLELAQLFFAAYQTFDQGEHSLVLWRSEAAAAARR